MSYGFRFIDSGLSGPLREGGGLSRCFGGSLRVGALRTGSLRVGGLYRSSRFGGSTRVGADLIGSLRVGGL